MSRWARPAPLLAAAALCACVAVVDEGGAPADALLPGQRVVLAAHAAPGPLIDETETNVGTAARILPGLGLVVQSAQDARLLETARGLSAYLPDWAPERRFYDELLAAFAQQGGGPLPPASAGVSTQTFRAMNRASDQIEWRRLYFQDHPDRARLRDYSKELSLDDAVILEANLTYGLVVDVEGSAVPTLRAALSLVKVNSMRRLWRREESAEDRAAAKTLQEFMSRPDELVAAWQRLLPELSARAAASYRQVAPPAAAPPAEGRAEGRREENAEEKAAVEASTGAFLGAPPP